MNHYTTTPVICISHSFLVNSHNFDIVSNEDNNFVKCLRAHDTEQISIYHFILKMGLFGLNVREGRGTFFFSLLGIDVSNK